MISLGTVPGGQLGTFSTSSHTMVVTPVAATACMSPLLNNKNNNNK